ncbi:metacaspase-3 [Trifolium repens]|nr:metacaspase-3 [Trifolium repens]
MTTKRALLVGMKYNEPKMIDTHMDCSRFEDCIIKYCGFHKSNIYTILDNKDSNPNATTRDAIVQQLRNLTKITKSRDILLFYYSGHGDLDNLGCPTLRANDLKPILGDQLQPIIEKLTTRNAVFTVIADSCHSGGFLKKAYEQIGHSVIDRGVMEPQGTLLSACQIDQTALSVRGNGSAFTHQLIKFIAEADGKITYWDLVMKIKEALVRRGAFQIPGLYCTNNEARAQIFEPF